MDYNILIKKAEEKSKELNILGKKWFDKENINFQQWRTRMYGYAPSLRYILYFLEENNSSKIKKFIINSSKKNSYHIKKVWVYIHIPFCIKKCPFCLYYVVNNPASSLVDKYITALKKHLDMWIKIIPNKLETVAIHLGGGTPTYLNAVQLDGLLNYINDRLQIQHDIFYTVEVNPKTIIHEEGKEKLKTLLNNGVNRLSIGIQSFDDSVLKFSKSGHNVDDAISSIKSARKMGFKNINIDLLLGLVGQTTKTWYKTLKWVKKLKPESITLYYLDFSRAHSYIHKLLEQKPFLFPDNKTLLIMNLMLIETLSELNYVQNRPSSFTKDPKYFWYPPMVDILPLGASSWSFYNNYHILNVRDINQYIDLINKGKLPLSDGIEFSNRLVMKKNFTTKIQFLNLGGLNKEEFKKEFDLTPEKAFGRELREFKREGLIIDQNGYLKLSLKGTLCVDELVRYMYKNN